jgi:hypothetical protein
MRGIRIMADIRIHRRRSVASARQERLALAVFVAFAPAACDLPSEDACRVVQVTSAIVSGYSRTEYLGISEAERGAIVAIQLERAGTGPDSCSGVALGAELVLTAAHCIGDDVSTVAVQGRTWQRKGDAEFSVDVNRAKDVALIRLPSLDAPGVLAPNDEDAARWRGGLVEIAGAGLREDGSTGGVEFAVAEVLDVTDRYLDVRLPQGGGPCGGDSGGPLLVRGASGRVEVAGVLSNGDSSCNGPDHYERVDDISSWLGNGGGAEGSNSTDCGALTVRGRCFGARVVWCDDGRVRASDCGGETPCGWDPESDGFRCVAPDSDPCDGVSDTGKCADEAAVRCAAGHLERLDCAPCGGSCQLSARSGDAVCALSK